MGYQIALATYEHPLDVMKAALALNQNDEPFAIAVITGTEGGAVRSPGAMMVVDSLGNSMGYLSGGCIDSDVAVQALATLKSGNPMRLRYGKGSPFLDIRLPCGGAIDLLVVPQPDAIVLRSAIEALEARKHCALSLSETQFELSQANDVQGAAFHYRPNLKLRIAGKGSEPIALAKLARLSGMDAEIWSPDDACLKASEILNLNAICLSTPAAIPEHNDDTETAFILMFHDTEWEAALLEAAIAGSAFYIGAVGSRSTHAKRCDELRGRGVPEQNLSRIRGPVGIVPSARDASTLAISILAEVVQEYTVKSAVL